MPNGRKPGESPKREPRPTRSGKPRLTPEQRKPAPTTEERTARKAKREAILAERQVVRESCPVERIAAPDLLLLPAKVQLAIEYWLDMPGRDLKKTLDRACEKVSLDPNVLRWYLKQENVRAIVDAKLEKMELAMAARRAEARVLSEDYLDAHTVKVLEDKATPSPQQVRMIEVGYKRFGMLKDKVEATGAGGAPLAFELVRIGVRKKDSNAPDDDTAL